VVSLSRPTLSVCDVCSWPFCDLGQCPVFCRCWGRSRHHAAAPGDRLARARNVPATSHTTELAARFGRGLLLGGYPNPAALHATLRVACISSDDAWGRRDVRMDRQLLQVKTSRRCCMRS